MHASGFRSTFLGALALLACGSRPSSDAPSAAAGSTQLTDSGGASGKGSESASAGAAPDAGGSATSFAGSSDGSAIVCQPDPGLPGNAPQLSTDTWTSISPPGFPFTDSTAATGVAISPCNPAVIYLCTGAFDPAGGGLYRSNDAGSTWAKIGRVPTTITGGSYLEGPNHVRVDPADPHHVYAVEGVRGNTEGFWVSMDGGDSFTMPEGFLNLSKTDDGIFPYDVYDLAVDPTDFAHILLSHHFGWGAKYGEDSGVLESTDSGASWTLHEPQTGWGTGHAINFLFDPALGLGSRDTWLLGTQGAGMWRTTDAGMTWTQVTTNGIQHGGGTTYYDKAGVLYASGTPHNLRSTDNGEHWTEIGGSSGYTAIFGDGRLIYTRSVFNLAPFQTSPEGGDGMNWSDFGTQQVNDGPFEMALDRTYGVLYSSSWGSGVLALKVNAP